MSFKNTTKKEQKCCPKCGSRNILEYSEYIQSKVKQDIPKPLVKKIARGQPEYPSIPENEILGCIDKAWQELGTERFRNVREAMPLIAKLVGEACKEHLYSKSDKALFIYYKQYLEGIINK